jgi:ribosomal protein L44E
MNKNTRTRLAQYRAKCKSEGGFPKPVYKKKAKPFPKLDKDADLSMRMQSLMFHGVNSIHAKKD